MVNLEIGGDDFGNFGVWEKMTGRKITGNRLGWRWYENEGDYDWWECGIVQKI